MTPVTTVTLSGLGLLNLLILLVLVRRVDALAARLDRPAAPSDPPPLPGVGTKVGSFTAVTTDGHRLSIEDFVGRTLVGFFAEGCGTCRELAPQFARHASVFPGGRDQVLVVVVSPNPGSPVAASMAPIARVVVEPGDGAVVRAFRVDGFPGFCVLQENVVVAAEGKLERLRLPVPG
ncbi:MAG TPA: thioredoxin domain-containing protein [Rugosimonospora sp.]|nr:thioredoxin domain-containing protein [Rugosimonospora sp.]